MSARDQPGSRGSWEPGSIGAGRTLACRGFASEHRPRLVVEGPAQRGLLRHASPSRLSPAGRGPPWRPPRAPRCRRSRASARGRSRRRASRRRARTRRRCTAAARPAPAPPASARCASGGLQAPRITYGSRLDAELLPQRRLDVDLAQHAEPLPGQLGAHALDGLVERQRGRLAQGVASGEHSHSSSR